MALTGVRSSSLSELLGKLEGAGLIQRTPCPSDLRTTLVSLTPAGRQKAAGSRTAARRSPFRPWTPQNRPSCWRCWKN